ncbi:MAG: DUF3127 domain-containing protein [Weeksellaceae bacterium]
MEVTGRVKKIFEEKTFGSGFRVQEIVLTTQEQYPQELLIQFTQDRINLLKDAAIGDEMKISINIKGREWINPEGVAKYFVSLDAWRIEKTNSGTMSPPDDNLPPLEGYTEADLGSEPDADDLPF